MTVTIHQNIFHQIFEESISVKILHYTVNDLSKYATKYKPTKLS